LKSVVVARLITFISVVIGWVLFRAESLSEASRMFSAMLGLRGLGDLAVLATRPLAVVTAGLALVLIFGAPNTWEIRFPRTRSAALAAACLMVLCILQFARPSPFLYFQF
jgi:alginate O-acetyltransferase complex protein AlgI